jgi:phosphoesterase RecJ-like protein
MSSDFFKLIEESKKILITSHISTDADALCSVLLSGLTLQKNFPGKKIEMVLEEHLTADLSFLSGFNEVKFTPLLHCFNEFEPDLILIVDASTIERCSRLNGSELGKLVSDSGIKVSAIDHHVAEKPAYAEVYINNRKPANVQQLYETLFEDMKLEKPEGYADITLLGIVFDTGRFKYDNPDHKNTFRIVSELLESGSSIEKLENRLDRYSKEGLQVMANLFKNVTTADGYSYSFIDDEFAGEWKKNQRPMRDFKAGCEQFVNRFIRNIEQNDWGFVVYPEIAIDNKSYSVSFRAEAGAKDVSELAAKLNGGGHKEAAGAKNIEADSIKEAIAQVIDLLK